MDNAMLIGLSRQLTLRREMDITANNIANINTDGFKAERVMLESRETRRARHEDGPPQVQFVGEWAMARDFNQGALTSTGRPLDLALDGPGFFVLETQAGDRFTRDGRFTLNAQGELTASDGARVLDEGGAPIVLDPNAGPVQFGTDGVLIQNGNPGARLALAVFEAPGQLSKIGDNRYAAPEDAARLDERPVVRQGFSESSNVRAILEMSRMMEVSRAYQSVTRMIRDADELSRKAIERLGRP